MTTQPTRLRRRIADAPTNPPRDSTLPDPLQIGPVKVEALSLAIVWCLEEINHPAAGKRAGATDGNHDAKLVQQDVAEGDAEKPRKRDFTTTEIVQLVYIFHDSLAAHTAFHRGGVSELNIEAARLMRTIPPDLLGQLVDAIKGRFAAQPAA